jgi:hypothetical protein
VSPDSPYLAALAAGLERLERVLIRVWQIISFLGVLTGVAYAGFVSRPLGFACAAGASAFFIWFVVVGHLADRGEAPASLPTVNAAIEALVPWVFFLAVVWAKGAEYALASWVPPFLYCSAIVSQVVRLRVWAPTILGVSGAVAYPAVYWTFVVERLPASAAEVLINQPTTQHVRAVTLAVSGVVASLLVLGLHAVVLGAESVARERELGGRFRILRDHSVGATGVVYEGEYRPEGGFSRRVAIRRYHPHVTEHAELMQGFRAAAERAARLVHPNFVQVVDFLRAAGNHFLVLEWVDGVSLDALTRGARANRQGLSPELVAYIGLELFTGLAHAHAAALDDEGKPLAVLHRDLAPDAVLVSIAGEVKIGGFAVARALRDFNRHSDGHAGYMPPERAQGVVDARGDLYSVCAILFELLLGRRHVPGEPARPSAMRGELGTEWDELFARGLADAPEARAESALTLLALLARVPRRDATETRAELGRLVEHVRQSHAALSGGWDQPGAGGSRTAPSVPCRAARRPPLRRRRSR